MKTLTVSTENEIFIALISRQTKFKVRCVEFSEKEIKGSQKQREIRCRARAKELAKIANDCW